MMERERRVMMHDTYLSPLHRSSKYPSFSSCRSTTLSHVLHVSECIATRTNSVMGHSNSKDMLSWVGSASWQGRGGLGWRWGQHNTLHRPHAHFEGGRYKQ